MAGHSDGTSGEGVASATTLHQVRPEWLTLHDEAALDPDLPIIDAHHHLWDVPGNRYLLDDYLADMATGHNVRATVYIQSGTMTLDEGPEHLRSVGETAFATAIAAQSERQAAGPRVAAAIVGPIDFSLGAQFAAVLDAHEAVAGGRLKGVRGLTHWHENGDVHKIDTVPGLLTTPAAHQAVAAVGRKGLSLDLWVYHTQLDDVLALARAFPDVVMILDHAGTPLGCGPYAGRHDQVLAEWRGSLRALAELPNVFVKLGGLAMRFSGFGFDHQARPPSSETLAIRWRPYVESCIDIFGADRCMFESNFPVDKASCSYVVLWNAFKRLAGAASPHERFRLFSGTAAAIYGL